ATGVWSGLNLAAGQSVTLTVTATVSATASGLIANTVSVSFPPIQGGLIDTNLLNNQAAATIVVLPSKRDFLASNFGATVPLIARFNVVNLTTPQLFAVGSGPGESPVVTVFNSNGTLAGTIMAFAPGFLGGVRVATADVNHDGIDDIIAAAGPGGGPHVRVFDGATGVMIEEFMAYGASFTGGVFVAAADVNHDGFADIVTGAGAGGGPHVEVFDGKTGALLDSFMAYNSGFTGGVTVAGGDINGDGFADVITGAGAGGGPHVRVFDGTNTSNLLRDFVAYSPLFGGGAEVAAGDVNGDGMADISTGAGSGGSPHVKVFSGLDNSVLASFLAYSAAFAGGVTVAAEDVNGDGLADIITGAGPTGGPDVEMFSGTGALLNPGFFAFNPTFLGGVFVG